MRRWAAIAVVFVLVSAVPAGGAAARPKCRGELATRVGTEGADRVEGTGGRDVIVTLGGRDVVAGGGGQDVICTGDGDDVVSGGDASDVVDGGGGGDTLTGDAGDDLVAGSDGTDFLAGSDGNDRIDGGKHSDGLWGGKGNDVLDAGPGIDTLLNPGAGNGVVVDLARGRATGDGRDTLRALENVAGTRFDDVITGSDALNALAGAGGDDRLDGRDGRDVFVPGPGSDAVTGGEGRDFVTFVESDRSVVVDLALGSASGEGSDRIDGVEDVQGTRGRDELSGDGGPNELLGHYGDDLLDGRGGRDRASYEDVSGGWADLSRRAGGEDGGTDRLLRIEDLEGSPGGSELTGDEGDNTIVGNDGEDVLSGGGGDDRLVGLRGDDTFLPGAGSDAIEGGDDTLHDVLDFSAADAPVNVDLARGRARGARVTGVEMVIGSPGDDVIRGAGARHEWLSGGDGDDTLSGGAGFDYVRGEDGDDVLDGGEWDDLVEGGLGADAVSGGPGIDDLYGEDAAGSAVPGNDELSGGDDHDHLYPGPGDDVVDGGAGVDSFSVGAPVAAIEADLGAGEVTGEGSDSVAAVEVVNGTAGDDVITGSSGPDALYGNGGADRLDGADGDDLVMGSAGDDELAGGPGDDRIAGGDGTDSADGGVGFDDCLKVEAAAGCERDEGEIWDPSQNPGFEQPYATVGWNGFTVPRELSLYVSKRFFVGRLAAVTGGPECEEAQRVVLERREDGEWVYRGAMHRNPFQLRLREPGTYRARALGMPGTDGLGFCAPATSPTVEVR